MQCGVLLLAELYLSRPLQQCQSLAAEVTATEATTGSAQSGSSTTDLQDSISAVRNRAGNLIDNPMAPSGNSQIRYGKAEPELAEDPINKDMEDLVRSMHTSLPSWNAESPSAPASAIAAPPSYSQGTGVQASAAPSSSGQNQGHRKRVAAQAA